MANKDPHPPYTGLKYLNGSGRFTGSIPSELKSADFRGSAENSHPWTLNNNIMTQVCNQKVVNTSCLKNFKIRNILDAIERKYFLRNQTKTYCESNNYPIVVTKGTYPSRGLVAPPDTRGIASRGGRRGEWCKPATRSSNVVDSASVERPRTPRTAPSTHPVL